MNTFESDIDEQIIIVNPEEKTKTSIIDIYEDYRNDWTELCEIKAYIQVKYKKLHPDAKVPVYATIGSGCFDIFCIEDGYIDPGYSKEFRTGLAFEIPEGHVMLVFSRSGHGFKHGIRLSNTTGIIDSDFRSEVMIKLHNDGPPGPKFPIEKGSRIAQGMIIPVPLIEFEEVSELSETFRGSGGFGSTGVK